MNWEVNRVVWGEYSMNPWICLLYELEYADDCNFEVSSNGQKMSLEMNNKNMVYYIKDK